MRKLVVDAHPDVDGPPRPASAPLSRARGLDPRRVLVVEDDPDARTALAELLERRTPHEIRTASDGAEALEMARTFVPDVVLLDLSLPDIDGLDLARRLRRDIGLSETTVIALTGRSTPGIEAEVHGAGCDALVRKPVEDVADLVRLVSGRHEATGS